MVLTLAALGFWAFQDRKLWFFGDEWDFLVSRGVWRAPTSPAGLLFPHNEHWSTLPLLLWRGLFSVFHLTSYWPYLVPLLLAQAVVAHLVWRTSLQAGATPWVATAAAGLLSLLGAGAEDFTWAFQIGFVGSVMFGLMAFHLIGAAHRRAAAPGSPEDRAAAGRWGGRPGAAPPGRRRRASSGRAAAGACACLVASLMCSTIGDAMVVGAAVLAVAHLDRRQMVTVVGVPVAVYALWFAVVGRTGLANHSDHLTAAVVTAAPGYALSGLSSALGQSANLLGAGGALLVGLAAWVATRAPALWRQAPVALALCAAVVTFYLLVALGRDATAVPPAVPRYIYVAMALLMPVLAVLLSGSGRSWLATVAAVALLAATALGNISQATAAMPARDATVAQLRAEVLGAGRLLGNGARDVSGAGASPIAPDPNLTAGDLARLQLAGYLGRSRLSALELMNARALLAVGTWSGSATALTGHALFGGKFLYLSSTLASATPRGAGCVRFEPLSASAPVQVWLAMAGGAGTASLLTLSPPAPAGTVDYLAAVLVPRRGPTSSVPVELAVPGDGRGYFDDNYPGARVVLTWDSGTPLTLCGLEPRR